MVEVEEQSAEGNRKKKQDKNRQSAEGKKETKRTDKNRQNKNAPKVCRLHSTNDRVCQQQTLVWNTWDVIDDGHSILVRRFDQRRSRVGDGRRESSTTLTKLLGCELSRWTASVFRWCNAHLAPVEANPTVPLGVATSQGLENVAVMG